MSDTKAVNKAFQLFQEKEYAKAVKAFEGLTNNDTIAPHIKARVAQFHKMAVAALEKGDDTPENSLQKFSFYMNQRRYNEAEALLASLEIDEDARYYLSAELEIEQGRREKALDLLRKAVELNEDNAGYALNSPSFASYVKESDFQFLRSDQ